MMSTFQNDNEELSRFSQRVVGTAFWVLAPIMIALFIFSDNFIEWLFPAEWAPAAIYLRYFCIIGFVYCFSDINQDILLVKGRTDILFRLDIIRRSILVIILLIGVKYDVETLLTLLVGYSIINSLVVSYIAGRLIHCNLWRQAGYVLRTPLYYWHQLRARTK